jgi:hypothetical protein
MEYEKIIKVSQAYADRVDDEVISNMDNFIEMAESRINRTMKVGEQTHRVYTSSIEGKEFYTLPPEFNGMRVVHFNTGAVDSVGSNVRTIDYLTPEQIARQQEAPTGGRYYTIINSQLQFEPMLPGGGTIEMVFYRKVPNLNPDNPNNWLSDSNPDIYISAITCEIELFCKNADASLLWNTRMAEAIADLKTNDVDKRWTGVGLTMRNE